jgi:hypothetical protein
MDLELRNGIPKNRHCIWDIRNGITITSRNCMTLVVINNWISTGVTSIAATTTEKKLALGTRFLILRFRFRCNQMSGLNGTGTTG